MTTHDEYLQTVAAVLGMARVQWRELCDRTTDAARGVLGADLDSAIAHLAEVRGYLDGIGTGRPDPAKVGESLRRKVRKLLGYTYP